MTTCFTATPGVDVITTTADIPALGSLAINAFVLHGSEPVLVDSLALVPDADRFVGPDQAALEAMLAGMVDVPA